MFQRLNLSPTEKRNSTTSKGPVLHPNPISFYIFLAWGFVLLARPQDIFIKLSGFRPALILGVVCIFTFIFQYSQYTKKAFFKNVQNRLFFLLVIMMFFSVPFAYYRGGAFKFLTTVYLNAIVFYFLFYLVIDTLDKLKIIIFICCIASILYSLSALKGGTSNGENRLVFGGMFDPNDLAYFIVSFLPLNFLFIKKNEKWYKRLICLASIIIGIIVIFLTGSRGGFLSLGIIGAIVLTNKSEQFTKKTKFRIMLLILISIPIITSQIDFSRLMTITNVGDDYNMYDETGRVQIWKRGLRLMYGHPFTGVGLNCFSQAIGEQRKEEGLQERWQAPHNAIIQIGTETGVIGALIYILLCYNAYKVFCKLQKKKFEVSLTAELLKLGFIGNFISSMFLSQAYSIYFVLFIAISASLMAMYPNIDESDAKTNRIQ